MFGLRYVGDAGFILFAGILCLAASSVRGSTTTAGGDDVVRIAVVGDSTVCNYDPAKTTRRGWGQLLPNYFKPGKVEVVNLAKSGRSSKSFLTEGLWEKVLALSPPPDYVLIQFAHNDALGKGPSRATVPDKVPSRLPDEGLGSQAIDWYRNNLRTYIKQARGVGAIPVLVTSMERRQFGRGEPLRKNLPYAKAALAVAKETGTTLLDLEAYSYNLYSELGEDGTKWLHFHREDSTLDNTHYNEIGARFWAEFVARQLANSVPELKPLIVIPPKTALEALVEKKTAEKKRKPLDNDKLVKTEPPMEPVLSDRFIAKIKARFPLAKNIALPKGGWDRIHFAQVFDRDIVSDADVEALVRERDLIWGAHIRAVEKGGYAALYYPSHRDFDQSRVFPGGSPVVRDLEWYRKNKPGWVVYEADRKTPAYGFVYDWGGYIPLDITREDVREYILHTFLAPAIERGWKAIAFDNVALDNQHKRCGVYRGGKWVRLYSGERRDSVYAKDMLDYLLWIKHEVNARGAALMLNGKVDPQEPKRTWALIALADIWFDEGGFSNHAKKQVVDRNWEVRYVLTRAKAKDGYYVGANTTGVEFENIPKDEIDWILANYLLVRGKNSFLSITGDRYTKVLLSYPPSFNPPVGLPRGEPRKVGKLYMRDYGNGFVAVNPSSELTLSFTPPPGNWVDRLGGKVSSPIILSPRSGTVLLKAKR